MTSRFRILCADDQQDVLDALRFLLKGDGLDYVGVTSPNAVLLALRSGTFDALVMDANYTRDTTGGKEGLDLLKRVRQLDPELPIIVITAWGNVEAAVEAMRYGAVDYVQKPWDNARLLATLRSQLEIGRARRRAREQEKEGSPLGDRDGSLGIVAESEPMKEVLDIIERIAPSDANVLIMGEPGTGKELVARRIHALSKRASKPFIAVDSGAFSEGIFESEMFGHVKGAFTDAKADRAGCFEMAHDGTLFLDEIGNLPLSRQPKLLRALQTGAIQRVGSSRFSSVNVRVLSASNADLHAEVAQARFRRDLLYRLNTVEVHIPPLRERPADILPLAYSTLARLATRYVRTVSPKFANDALDAMIGHTWPGNVRELEHVVERALLMTKGEAISARDLALRCAETTESAAPIDGMTLDEAERYLLERAMQRAAGNVREAARLLGLSRSSMYRRLERWGLGSRA